MINEEFISHFGVLGMKWGHHSHKAKSKAQVQQRLKESRTISDVELRSRINRIRMETEYMKLVAPAQPKSRIRRVMESSAMKVANQTTTTVMQSVANKAIKEGLKTLAKKSKK